VASCDLAVAAASARFATPGVRIGLFCSTPMVALSRSVPAKTAMRMLLTGDFLAADQALNFGLVSDVVDDDELEDATEALAHRVASVSSATVAIGKSAFYEQRELPVDEAYERMSQVMAHNAVTVDAQEGIDAFLSKREPRWRHRGADAGDGEGWRRWVRERDSRGGDCDRSQRLHRWGHRTCLRRPGGAGLCAVSS